MDTRRVRSPSLPLPPSAFGSLSRWCFGASHYPHIARASRPHPTAEEIQDNPVRFGITGPIPNARTFLSPPGHESNVDGRWAALVRGSLGLLDTAPHYKGVVTVSCILGLALSLGLFLRGRLYSYLSLFTIPPKIAILASLPYHQNCYLSLFTIAPKIAILASLPYHQNCYLSLFYHSTKKHP